MWEAGLGEEIEGERIKQNYQNKTIRTIML